MIGAAGNHETAETRAKRLRMRAWHRGTKEMDLILGRFADRRLGSLSEEALGCFDALLSENDHDLYRWVAGQEAPPDRYADLVDKIAADTADAGRDLTKS